jgi:SAM-dependent methyltransferase
MTGKIQSKFHLQAKRRGLVAAIPENASVIELGPFGNPTMRGSNVSYFDVLTTEELCIRAVEHQHDPEAVPYIDFVSPNGDLSVVDGSFDIVFSAHCLEHQPDLIHHINQVNELLVPGGKYFLVLPDKRYCFDHFFSVSNIGDVLQAHRERRTVHTISSVIESVLGTHNRKKRHWLGFHGRPGWQVANIEAIKETLESFDAANGGYIDVHAWQFIPASFLALMTQLHELGMIGMQPVQVCATPLGRREFTAVLQKK